MQGFVNAANGEGRRIKPAHLSCEDTKKQFPNEWRDYFKISFVRNPWDRHVSLYYHNRNKIWKGLSFEDVVAMSNRGVLITSTYTEYVFDIHSRKQLVDFVGRVENIQADFDHLCTVLKLPNNPKLGHLHKHHRRKHYTEYYTEPWMIEKIRTFYDPELIERLGYKYGE
jgi:hypothetical protein